MRVYLPSTLPLLRAAVDAGEFGPPPLAGCAVTPALREWYVEGDSEELEYAALTAAARASLRMLATDPAAPRRRVVVAADVAGSAVRPASSDRAAVTISVAVPIPALAAVHLDDPAAVTTVEAAVQALPVAGTGEEDADFRLAEAEAQELLWYASSELRELLAAEPPARPPAR